MSLTLEDRILKARCRLTALSFLLSELEVETSLPSDAAAGLSMMVDDILQIITPIADAPYEVTSWRAPDPVPEVQ